MIGCFPVARVIILVMNGVTESCDGLPACDWWIGGEGCGFVNMFIIIYVNYC